MEIGQPRRFVLVLLIFVFVSVCLMFTFNSCLIANISYAIPKVRFEDVLYACNCCMSKNHVRCLNDFWAGETFP